MTVGVRSNSLNDCHTTASSRSARTRSNSRLRQNARKLGVGAREFLRFASLRACDRSRV